MNSYDKGVKSVDFSMTRSDKSSTESDPCLVISPAKDDSVHTNKRILLVDDEVLIGNLTAEMLVDMGFEVTTESSSVNALETFHKDGDRFDLIITDQSMPGLTGADLIAEIRKVRRDIPVIICTGFIHDIDRKNYGDLNIAAVCQKPFEFDQLQRLVKEVLVLV